MSILKGNRPANRGLWGRAPSKLSSGKTIPVLSLLAVFCVIWFAAAVPMNAARVIEEYDRSGTPWSVTDLIRDAWSMERPVLPAPHQVVGDMWRASVGAPLNHPRNLLYHAGVTLQTTVVGFLAGTLLGILIAVGILYVRTLERSLMPWVIVSQTVPILAIAPIVVVLLGNLGFSGLTPKATISAYSAFFPVTIAMVKGLRSPDPMQLDLMKTYNARRWHVFAKLRWSASIALLLPSLKVAAALALVGAMVSELKAGAGAGLGARLLIGSYYGLMLTLWSALMMSALLAMVCIGAVSILERWVVEGRGGRL